MTNQSLPPTEKAPALSPHASPTTVLSQAPTSHLRSPPAQNTESTPVQKPEPMYVGGWHRLIAGHLDVAIMATLVFTGLAIINVLEAITKGATEMITAATVFLLPPIILVGYQVVATTKYGATVGKKLFGLVIVNNHGNPANRRQLIIRSLSYIISFPFVLGFFWAVWGFDYKKRGWHDFIAKTTVVRSHQRSSVGKIATAYGVVFIIVLFLGFVMAVSQTPLQ